VTVARNIAGQRNLSPQQAQQLETVSVATAYHESGFSPTAVGDQGTSFGEFQLHQGGELGSLTPQQAFNPATNAATAIPIIADRLQTLGYSNPGAVAASAQRPADQSAYASAIDSLLSAAGPGQGFRVTPGGIVPSSPPLTITPGATTPGGGSTPNPGTTTIGSGTGSLLAKIAGFLIGALLVGIGLIILFKDDSPAVAKVASKVAVAE
jgi:hypothetical protein